MGKRRRVIQRVEKENRRTEYKLLYKKKKTETNFVNNIIYKL